MKVQHEGIKASYDRYVICRKPKDKLHSIDKETD